MQIVDLLTRSPLFTGVDRETLEALAADLTVNSHPKDCDILQPMGSADRFHILTRGRVKIARSNEHNGRELTLWLLGPGDGFDIVSLLDGEPHIVSAWTLDEVETLSVQVHVFREWLERYPQLRLPMYRYIAGKLRELTDLAGSLALHDTMTRLAHLLLRHFDTAKTTGSRGINLISDLSHEEIAALIGSVRVVVNRLLARLRRATVVDVHRGRLNTVNLKRLMRHAETHSARAARKAQRERTRES